MESSNTLRWITGAIELFLAIPFLGGLIVGLSGGFALAVTFVLHLIVLIISFKNEWSKTPPILGIITSLLASIPFLGWFLHVVTGIVYFVYNIRRA
ncbi:hypothetical protein [Tuberibacillus sp. Marseille-P3662]|uniref:hypothetical protein n=1 Tax=Tuberibacillus sp. Marseille-P3662 TaxID=1965358 RepID=UPI000A1CCA97|nr:hypothetical protein [Tuberibacillus sp. Marseille-P3662]